MTSTPFLERSVVAAAVRDTVPVAASIAPLALVIGATAARSGVPVPADMAGAAFIFAGAAHLAVLTTLGAGALTALSAAALINVRLLLYSASIEPRFRHQPRWFRWLGPALLIDQTYLMVTARDDLAEPVRFRRYWSCAGGLLIGLLGRDGGAGQRARPAAARRGAAGRRRGRGAGRRCWRRALKAWRTAAVAVTALLAAAVLPGGIGLLVGIVAGAAVGAVLDRWAS